MKIKLLLLIILICPFIMFSQITAGQVDDFENGRTQDWAVGAAASSQISNVETGGPTGVDDNFLQYATTGAPGGPGSKMIVFNRAQWTGDYSSANIVEIQFDAKVEGTNDLEIRFSLSNETGIGTPSGTKISSTNSVVVPAGTGWNSYAIPISVLDFTVFEGSGTVADVLANVAEARILHAPTPNWFGLVISGTMQFDNITASTTLSRKGFKANASFNIYPNPSKTHLNINIPSLSSFSKIEVYNILGSRIYSSNIQNLKTTINVNKWHSGVYLVRVSNAKETISKRFVKQ